MKLAFRDQSASIILLPSDQWADELLDLVENWTKSWLIQPAYWIKPSSVSHESGRPPEVTASIIGRNGRKEVNLFQQLSRYSVKTLRLISIRTIDEEEKRTESQNLLIKTLAKYVGDAKPQNKRINSLDIGNKLIKINLIFAPSEISGASYPGLHEPDWTFNIVVAPEDRATPTGFDSFISSKDRNKYSGFILSNTATAAGIWTGQSTSAYEEEEKLSQSSAHFNKVLVQRSFTRAVVSDALAFRISAQAMKRLLLPLDGIEHHEIKIKFFNEEVVDIEIEKLVSQALGMSNSQLDYKSPEELKDPDKKKISLKKRITILVKFVFGIHLNLPIWIFTAIWQGISKFVSQKIDSSDGEYEIDGEIDFPSTKLDKLTDAELVKLEQEKTRAQLLIEDWPKAHLRKAYPHLFSELRQLIFSNLESSPENNSHSHAFSDPSVIVPNYREFWKFSNLENYEQNKELFKIEDALPEWLEREVLFVDDSSLQDMESIINNSLHHLNDELRRESAEIDTLKTELEFLTDKYESNSNQLRISQLTAKYGEDNE